MRTKTIIFCDWDDYKLGVLVLDSRIEDARPFVDFFVAANMIHPQLRGSRPDPWAAERTEKRTEALQKYPRRRVYPEERFLLAPGEDGLLEIRHELEFVPGEYMAVRRPVPFRPPKIREVTVDG